jgi:hypothetical protein
VENIGIFLLIFYLLGISLSKNQLGMLIIEPVEKVDFDKIGFCNIKQLRATEKQIQGFFYRLVRRRTTKIGALCIPTIKGGSNGLFE